MSLPLPSSSHRPPPKISLCTEQVMPNNTGNNVVPYHQHPDEDDGLYPAPSTAVAIDRDKNSQQAVKWATDHLLTGPATIVLIHVITPAATSQGHAPEGSSGGSSGEQLDSEIVGLFRSYRLFCARKGIRMKQAILEDVDVTKALIEYITTHHITSVVCGASNRNALTRKLIRTPDVPTALLKLAPDFCGVYVIWKGKTLSVRSAKSQAPAKPLSLRQQQLIATSPRHPTLAPVDAGDSVRSPFNRGSARRSPLPQLAIQEAKASDHLKTPRRPQHYRGGKVDSGDGSVRQPRGSSSRGSSFDELDFQGRINSLLSDHTDNIEFSSASNDSSNSSNSPRAGKDLEAEMKRLRQELKQTMDMYSTACKEAITAKQTAKELHQWKIEEAQRLEAVRKAEEAALAMVEMEKARAKAAIEAAQAAQKLAELEARKRLSAEMAAKREAEEKKKALEALAQNDVRYRKYSIEEIEVATDNFAEGNKIGEGGYGPVYKGILDHTHVAIKILRPDAAQGRKQFQQEVEVLCCIRHPNMVLLLGACPEYGCLVYEYMENGSLDDRLFRRGNSPTLSWPLRFKIAAEIATSLLFLHQTKPEPLVHRDLKPANILLDRNFVSKISDVGLARLVPPSVANAVTQYRMTATAGTFCYIDPEYQQTGMLGIKSDIYSLGILLLQVVTAKPPMGLAHHVERAMEKGSFREMLDPAVPDWPVEEAAAFARVALRCAELRRKDRPDLGKVVLPELNRLRAFGQDWEAKHRPSAAAPGPFGITAGGAPRAWPPQGQARSNPLQQRSSGSSDGSGLNSAGTV